MKSEPPDNNEKLKFEQDAIRQHLKGEVIDDNGTQYFTGFTAAIRDARVMTGRDPATGSKVDSKAHICWLGNLGYMVLLDQLGKCFSRKGRTIDQKCSGFVNALRMFTDLDEERISLLYKLRCSLAHDFSLIAQDRDGKLTHHFRLVDGPDHPLVTPAIKPWDGLFALRSDDDKTTVNLEKFADMVETVVQTILGLNERGEVVIRFRDTWYDLIHRYAVSFKRTCDTKSAS